jgi:hypothetical protein
MVNARFKRVDDWCESTGYHHELAYLVVSVNDSNAYRFPR